MCDPNAIIQSVATQFQRAFERGPLTAFENLATGGVIESSRAVAGDFGPKVQQGAIQAGEIAATIGSAGAAGAFSGGAAGAADAAGAAGTSGATIGASEAVPLAADTSATALSASAPVAAEATAVPAGVATDVGATALPAGVAGSGGASALSAGADLGSVAPAAATGTAAALPVTGTGGGGATALSPGSGTVVGTDVTSAPTALGPGASASATAPLPPATTGAATNVGDTSALTNTALGPVGGTGAGGNVTAADEAALQTQLDAANPSVRQAVDSALGPEQPTSLLGKIGSFAANHPTLLAAAAPTALTLLRGQQPVPQQFQPLNAGGAVTSPLLATEQAQLTEANTGILQPGQADQIAQYAQQAEAQLRQQLANEGVTDPTQDSRFIQGMAVIQQNMQVQRQQFIDAALRAGTTAAGDASSALQAAGNAQIQQDNNFQQALASATESFGLIAALSKQAA